MNLCARHPNIPYTEQVATIRPPLGTRQSVLNSGVQWSVNFFLEVIVQRWYFAKWPDYRGGRTSGILISGSSLYKLSYNYYPQPASCRGN